MFARFKRPLLQFLCYLFNKEMFKFYHLSHDLSRNVLCSQHIFGRSCLECCSSKILFLLFLHPFLILDTRFNFASKVSPVVVLN